VPTSIAARKAAGCKHIVSRASSSGPAPSSTRKLTEVVELYLDPPEWALVLCVERPNHDYR